MDNNNNDMQQHDFTRYASAQQSQQPQSQPQTQQYGFDHYGQFPLGHRSLLEKVIGARAANTLRSPMVLTVGFLLVGAAFAGLVISSYSGDGAEEPAPVVKADSFAYKTAPDEAGGMEIRHKDSTIYMSMLDEQVQENTPVENAADGEPGPQEKLEEFARQVEEITAKEQAAEKVAAVEAVKEEPKKIENLLENSDVESGEKVVMAMPEVPALSEENIDREPESVGEAVPEDVRAPDAVETQQPRVEPPRIAKMHEAGSNPETLEFVRSVLEKKDAEVAMNAMPNRVHEGAAKAVADIQPAAGSQVGGAIASGSHYVQLGSVTSAGGAEGEWRKIQASMPVLLGGLEHRVKTADLGERGVYYRIQVGPMSKESASSLCDSIKMEKPGGCLVTQ